MVRRLGLLLVVAIVFANASLPAIAAADEALGEGEPAAAYEPPSDFSEPPPPPDQHQCPEPPEDAAEVEYSPDVYQLPAICRALADRLDRVRERAFWSAAEVRRLRSEQAEDQAQLRDRLDAIHESQPPADAAEEQYGPELVRAVTSSGEATSGAIWFLVGLSLVVPVAGIIWMTVKRGIDGR